MPRLVFFGVCQLSSLDRDNNSPSLFGLATGFTVPITEIQNSLAPGETIDENLALPMPWSCVALWKWTPEDEGVTYEQRVEVINPRGEVYGGGAFTRFSKDQHPTYSFRVNGNAFPIGLPGEYQVRLSIRRSEQEQETEWHIAHDYPLEVTHAE